MPITKPQIALLVLNAGGTAGHSPADSTTYTIGANAVLGTLTTDGVYFPIMTRAGVVRRARVFTVVAGTLGSGESGTIRVRNVTSTAEEQISAAMVFSATGNHIGNEALSLAFTVGDLLNAEFTTPAWVTNPTTVFYNVTLEVEFY